MSVDAAAGESFGEPAMVAAHGVMLVEGSTFCVSGRSGDLDPQLTQGLFFRDTRILSTWRLRVAGQPPQIMSVQLEEAFCGVFLARLAPAGASTQVLIERRRYIGDGMREDLRVRNLDRTARRLALSLEIGADFADVFAVKEERVASPVEPPDVQTDDDRSWAAWSGGAGAGRGVRVETREGRRSATGLEFAVELEGQGEWTASVLVHPTLGGRQLAVTFPLGRSVRESRPARRLQQWRRRGPQLQAADHAVQRTFTRSHDDLGSLRIVDPVHPSSIALAAGAPWFMALFGRDSLLSSYMAMALDPALALGTLQALARVQGVKLDPRTEEQPGRILHETRLGLDFPLSHGGGSVYYGSADATPLFVLLLGELLHWGAFTSEAAALLPHADRALEWIVQYGDSDADGFVEYARMSERGLRNQGWKDSHDGLNFADGGLAEPPIALCEVQGYVYGAFLVRAHIARQMNDPTTARSWLTRAAVLKRDFNERFWLPDRGWFAVGLDRDKKPIDALASNMGHCLWTGLIDEDKAPAVAAQLMSPEMFTGWGVRTLAASMGAYNPMSYHNGSVWPHDNALIASGLMRYGFVEQAQQLAGAVLDAAAAFDGRLPELFCGFDRGAFPAPLPYPTSCSPQAWASATPIQLLRTLLRLEPDLTRRQIHFAPAWPSRYGSLLVRDIRLGGDAAAIALDADGASLSGVGDDVSVVHRPRPFPNGP